MADGLGGVLGFICPADNSDELGLGGCVITGRPLLAPTLLVPIGPVPNVPVPNVLAPRDPVPIDPVPKVGWFSVGDAVVDCAFLAFSRFSKSEGTSSSAITWSSLEMQSLFMLVL